MKKLFFLIITFFTVTAIGGDLPNIVAFVNDQPLTAAEFRARKQMFLALNSVDKLDSAKHKEINKIVVNSLINEVLLNQIYKGKPISEAEIAKAIANIDVANKNKPGYLLDFIKSKSIDIAGFKAQIKADLIKNNLMSMMYRNITISPLEVEHVILSTNSKDAALSMKLIVSNDKGKKTLDKMYSLHRKLRNCTNIANSGFNKFATIEHIDNNLSRLAGKMLIIARDLEIDEKSGVFEDDDGFKIVVMCNKKILNMSTSDDNYVTNFITNKKLSQKMAQFLENIRRKAYVKIMIPT